MHRRSFLQGACCAALVPLTGRRAFAQSAPGPAFLDDAAIARLPSDIRRCATDHPGPESYLRILRATAQIKEADAADDAIEVPVVFHILHKGPTYRVSENRIDRQIAVLNADFAPANVQFFKRAVNYHDKPEWCEFLPTELGQRFGLPDLESGVKKELNDNPTETLNVYSMQPLIRNLLGWARFPWDLEIRTFRDGVVINHETFPDNPKYPSMLGRTATHEVGHWLGLLHTFQNGCTEPGDGVADTPFRQKPSNACPAAPPSCPTSATVTDDGNHMDYLGDACAQTFTQGQIARMKTMARVFRPKLVVPAKPAVVSKGGDGPVEPTSTAPADSSEPRPARSAPDRINAIIGE